MMFMITYRSRDPKLAQETSEKLNQAIGALGPKSAGFFSDVWMLQSNLNAANIRDVLRANLNPGDRIFVARISQNWAGINMGDKFPDWLKSQNFGTFRTPPQST